MAHPLPDFGKKEAKRYNWTQRQGSCQSRDRRLKRELANVEEEREILKKVLNIFSRKSG
jgi:hypothetical protein